MIRTLLLLLIVGWIPGALMLRMPGASQRYRASLPADERAFWSVLLSSVWSVMVVLALGAAGRYSLGHLVVANVVACALFVVALRRRLRWPHTAGPWPWSSVVLVALVGLGSWMYFPAAEYVIGGKDPGTYINEGIQIAQRGQVIVRDEVIRSVPPPFRGLFFPPHNLGTYYGLRFMGFFIQDPAQGTVVGQFPHFYPASIAIGYGVHGLTGARNTIGVWAILALVAVYFAGARVVGRAAAAAAVIVMAVNVVVIWFARYPNSEFPMQALIFAALLAVWHARAGGGVFFATLAGALLGVTLFLRYEVLLALAAFAGVAVLAPVSRERIGWGFAAGLTATGGVGLWYLLEPMRAYSAYPLGFLSTRGGWGLGAMALVAALACHQALRVKAVADAVRRWLPPAVALTLGALALYAYFIRQTGGRTAEHDAMAFRTFGWYLTPPVLAAAVGGTIVIVWTRFWTAPAFFAIIAIFSAFFFYKTRIVPEHFWTTRRFLGVALPGALLMAAGLVRTLVSPARLEPLTTWITPKIASAVSAAVVIAAAVPVGYVYWTHSAPVRAHVEYAGLIPRLEALANRIGPNDLVLVESRNAGSDLHVLAMPLGYIYARHVLVLDSPIPDKRLLDTFIAWARTRYATVWFLGGGGTDLLTRHVSAEPITAERFQVPEYDSPVNRYPTGVHQKEFEFGLYRLTQAGPRTPGPVTLAIGGLDDLNVVRFHAREVRGDTGEAFRWSRGQSRLLVPGIAPDARTLTLWLSGGGRPAGVPRANVDISFAGRAIGTAQPRDAWEAFTFALPPELVTAAAATGDPVTIQLRSTVWVPATVVGGSDTRELGVAVARVDVR